MKLLLLLGLAAVAAASTVTLQSSQGSPNLGQTVTFTATAPPSATGAVTFFDGVNILGIGQLANGQATLRTSLLAAGTHSIVAAYGQNSSAPISITVRALPGFGFQPAQSPTPVSYGNSIAVADFNNDGIPDLVMSSIEYIQMVGAEINNMTVLLGNGDGTFRAASQPSGGPDNVVVTGDFNGDGIADLATFGGVYLGNGDGTFQAAIPIGLNFNGALVSLAVGDFNGDGRADLAWSGWYNGTSVGVVGVLPGNGDGTFGASVNTNVANGGFLAIGDFNHDGRPDLAVSQGGNSNAQGLTILPGNGDGTFQTPAFYGLNYPTNNSTKTIAVADFNGDGRDDVVVGGYSSTSDGNAGPGYISVFLSNPDGTFQNPSTIPLPTTGPLSLAVGDFDGDGRMDVAYAPYTAQVYLLLGNGDGTLQAPTEVPSLLAGAIAAGDFNQDGRTDLADGVVLLGQAAPQGAVTISNVLSAASFQPPIESGSWVMIQGTSLANGARVWQSSDFIGLGANLPTVVDGVSVTIDGKPAFVEYISPTQINVQAPSDTSTGPVNVVVTNNGHSSAPANAQLQAVAPALFMTPQYNAVASTLPNYTPVTSTAPAMPGDMVVFWGTGFGPTTPPIPAGTVVTGAPATATLPIVTVGGLQVPVISSVLTAGTVGLYQITIQLPANVPTGAPVVQASIGGVQTLSGVTLLVGAQ